MRRCKIVNPTSYFYNQIGEIKTIRFESIKVQYLNTVRTYSTGQKTYDILFENGLRNDFLEFEIKYFNKDHKYFKNINYKFLSDK